jgi:ABC-type sugar transport system ATPase subunit
MAGAERVISTPARGCRDDVHSSAEVDGSSSAAAAVNVVKTFGGVTALRGASLTLFPGEIHGLIGQNGSGKSTLLGLLSGQIQPDSGHITVGSRAVRMSSPYRALQHGVAMVSQEIALAGDLTVGENIFLGHAKPRRGFQVRWRQLYVEASKVLADLDLDLDPRTPVANLSLDQQQLVEVARALVYDARVLILDEPTSALPDNAVERLFNVIRRLRAKGTATVFVSHRLDELLAISDRVTVFRDGKTVGSRRTADYTVDELTSDMLGRELTTPDPLRRFGEHGLVVLVAADVGVAHRVQVEALQVRAGESVGLVGLAGSGKAEFMQALFGLWPSARGEARIGGERSMPRTPIDAVRRGIAYIPPDRKADGLVLDMTVHDNLQLARQACRSQASFIRRRSEADATAGILERMQVHPRRPGAPVRQLSGGNQQKVLIGKWLATDPYLFMLDEPTRGVDVGSKNEIHRLLLERRSAGMALIISSTDLAELFQLCDRFLIFSRGKVVAEIDRESADIRTLSELSSGLRRERDR